MSDGEPMPTPRVELAIGDDAPPEVTLRFPPRLLVEGRLIDAISGEGMQGQVAVWRPDEATKDDPDWGSVVTDKDGHFAIRFFSAGAQVLRGYAHGGGASVPREIVLPEGGGSVTVDLPVDPPLAHRRPGGRCVGRVVSDARVYASWRAKSMPGQSAIANTTSLADGTFVLTPRDPHGLYDIAAAYPEVNVGQRLSRPCPPARAACSSCCPCVQDWLPSTAAFSRRTRANPQRAQRPSCGRAARKWLDGENSGRRCRRTLRRARHSGGQQHLGAGARHRVRALAECTGSWRATNAADRSLARATAAGCPCRARDAQGHPLADARARRGAE
jgi:hypothetical protein